MSGGQILGALFLMAGVAALGVRRQDQLGIYLASDAVLLVLGVSAMLVGAIFFLLSYLKRSVEL